jgi:hypothetical protein
MGFRSVFGTRNDTHVALSSSRTACTESSHSAVSSPVIASTILQFRARVLPAHCLSLLCNLFTGLDGLHIPDSVSLHNLMSELCYD